MNKLTESKFAENAELIRQGNMQGLKAIYEEYAKMIYFSVLNLCGNSHTAEDVTSEFFLKLSSAVSVYRSGLGHKRWLLVSARNLAIDFMRKQSREIPLESSGGDEESHPLSDIPDDENTEESVISDLTVQQLLSGLDENKREVIHLKLCCGLTFSEIGEVLHIPTATAAWRYSQGIAKLRKLYKEVCGDE